MTAILFTIAQKKTRVNKTPKEERKMRRKRNLSCKLIVLVLCVAFLATACGNGNGQSGSSGNNSNGTETTGKMTDVGTPRAETLIVDMLSGRATNVSQWNPYLPGEVDGGSGGRQCVYEPLWDVDSIKGEQVPILAESMAEPIDDTYTKFHVKLREGVTWSDGVEFTAEDVAFTADMLLNTPELAYGAAFATTIKSMTAVDKYTLEIETVNSEAKIEQFLGITVVDTSFRIMPKHIWENEDPTSFNNAGLISTGPYVLDQIDPQGNWFLYEKREDWAASATGMIYGEPKPNYVLFRSFGSEERRVMAAIQNEVDILCDVTPESWTVLSQQNPESMAWYENFPYATMDDPAGRGITFNSAQAPFDDVDVRWALLLAIDLKSASLSTYSGQLRATPLILAPTEALSEVYHNPMVDWLKDFELSDGYKPFDDNFAVEMVEELKKQGIEGLPDGDEEAREIFGVGWWKYDVEQAEKMLVEKGFSRDTNDKWLLPDGTPWQINFAVQSGFEVLAERMGYAVIDSWQQFGIDVVAQPADFSTLQNLVRTGSVDCSIGWPTISVIADATGGVRDWHSEHIVPIGEMSPTEGGAVTRYGNDKIDEIIDELVGLPSDDPRVIELITEFQKEIVINAPFAAMFGTSKLVPVTTHYWTNFQSSENNFEGPWWWWSNMRSSFAQYEPTGNQ